MFAVLLGYFVAQVKTYPIQGWSVYPEIPREYSNDEYYYAPKIQYYYDAPAINVPDMQSQIPYSYYYDPYAHMMDNEAPKLQEERLAALPVGQETWFESDTTPRWRSNDVDDVSAAFLDNLILTQMAQDAQRRRDNARAAFPSTEFEERDMEDEDVRELKALAGKPLYHVAKTVPRYDDDDYAADDGFINWNSNKRSITPSPDSSLETAKMGQKEVVMPRPPQLSQIHHKNQMKRNDFYNTMAHLLTSKTSSDNQVSVIIHFCVI